MKAPAPLLAADAGSLIGLAPAASALLRGHDPAALDARPAGVRQPPQTLTTAYAGSRLAGMEARAHVACELRSTE